MKRTQISDNIEYVIPDTMSNFTSCAGLIISGPLKIFIDTNMGIEETKALLKSERPDIAIISHYHLDHATWGQLVLELTQADLYIPEGEEKYFTSLDYFIEMTAAPYGLVPEWTEFATRMTCYREIDHFSTYNESSVFRSGHITVQCIRTQGHSPSHTSFYLPGEKILFTGDMGVDRFGPWYGWVDCDLKQLVDSILKLRSMDVDLLLTSHGGMISEGILQCWNQGLKQIMEREQFVRDGLDLGKKKAEIVEQGIFFKNKSAVKEPMRSFLFMWDTIMFDHHQALLEEGGLERFFPEIGTLSQAYA